MIMTIMKTYIKWEYTEVLQALQPTLNYASLLQYFSNIMGIGPLVMMYNDSNINMCYMIILQLTVNNYYSVAVLPQHNGKRSL